MYGNLFRNIRKDIDIDEVLFNILESSFDGIYITDGSANTIMVNKSYEKITGLNREELIGKNMRDLIKHGTISISGTLLCLTYKKVVTLEQSFKTDKKALITSQPMLDSKGNIVMIVTNVRDMTQISKLQESLKENVLQKESIQATLNQFITNKCSFKEFVCVDKKSVDLIKYIDKIASTDAPIGIFGETGVGKEILAQYIFKNSDRSDKPFLKLNCGELNPNLIESELFGYEKGTFTGGNKNGKIGLFEMANSGTLFLDEISELDLNLQVKLLRVLQEQEIRRLGSTKTIKIDVRIITASNKRLEDLVQQGTFRKDLYYRLETFQVVIPPLRERKDDIKPLVLSFLKKLNDKYCDNKTISEENLELLKSYTFPGNVRELKNLIYRAYIISGNELEFYDLGGKINKIPNIKKVEKENEWNENEILDLDLKLKKIEYEYIKKALSTHKTIRAAAAKLSMDSTTLFRKKKKYEKIFDDVEQYA